MTFIDSILSHMSSITTWKRVRNSRTHPKVPITIIIIIIIVLPLHYFFLQSIIISRSFSSLLSLEVPHSHVYIYIYILVTFLRHPVPRSFVLSVFFYRHFVVMYVCTYEYETKIPLVCVCVMILAYASTRFIHYVIASHTVCVHHYY
jgi:hypothetical protein